MLPFTLNGHLSRSDDGLWQLSATWLVVLEIKRGTIGPTALCKEGLSCKCTIATLVLVSWSTLDLAAIQEGGDGKDGMLLD